MSFFVFFSVENRNSTSNRICPFTANVHIVVDGKKCSIFITLHYISIIQLCTCLSATGFSLVQPCWSTTSNKSCSSELTQEIQVKTWYYFYNRYWPEHFIVEMRACLHTYMQTNTYTYTHFSISIKCSEKSLLSPSWKKQTHTQETTTEY